MEDNDTIEKYCYGNNLANCDNYGGLYKWNEMMQYTTQQGAQGICPPGWHIPEDEEWKILEGAVDSQYRIGNQIWNFYGLRGYDAGKNLKTISGWNGNGNGTDLFGFSGLPGGYRYSNGYFYYITNTACGGHLPKAISAAHGTATLVITIRKLTGTMVTTKNSVSVCVAFAIINIWFFDFSTVGVLVETGLEYRARPS